MQPSVSPPNGGGNYAAALRSGSCAAITEHSSQPVAHLTDDQILAHFNPAQSEVYSVLPPALLRAVLDAVRRAAPRLQAQSYLHGGSMQSVASLQSQPGGPLGPPDIAVEFLAAVNAAALSRPPLAGMLANLSEAAVRELVLAGLPPNTLPTGTPAPTLAALKPMVRREVIALADMHADSLSLSHFDAGVLSHLQRRPEPLVAAALREIARRPDLPSASNKPAYLTHWLMKLADDPSMPSLAGVSPQHPAGLIIQCDVCAAAEALSLLRGCCVSAGKQGSTCRVAVHARRQAPRAKCAAREMCRISLTRGRVVYSQVCRQGGHVGATGHAASAGVCAVGSGEPGGHIAVGRLEAL